MKFFFLSISIKFLDYYFNQFWHLYYCCICCYSVQRMLYDFQQASWSFLSDSLDIFLPDFSLENCASQRVIIVAISANIMCVIRNVSNTFISLCILSDGLVRIRNSDQSVVSLTFQIEYHVWYETSRCFSTYHPGYILDACSIVKP